MAWWDDEPWTTADAGEDPYYRHGDTRLDPWAVTGAELEDDEWVS